MTPSPLFFGQFRWRSGIAEAIERQLFWSLLILNFNIHSRTNMGIRIKLHSLIMIGKALSPDSLLMAGVGEALDNFNTSLIHLLTIKL
jgi:hypothetical protein